MRDLMSSLADGRQNDPAGQFAVELFNMPRLVMTPLLPGGRERNW
jgi:hypothetical protein